MFNLNDQFNLLDPVKNAGTLVPTVVEQTARGRELLIFTLVF